LLALIGLEIGENEPFVGLGVAGVSCGKLVGLLLSPKTGRGENEFSFVLAPIWGVDGTEATVLSLADFLVPSKEREGGRMAYVLGLVKWQKLSA
jgi:hypothetical protein